MSDLRNAWSIDNLKLAWQRVRSNPDRAYKSYFRNQYAAYALADEAQLRHLQNRLSRGIFQPTDACKIYFPKPSGILRPYSLLSVEDQIVYQAIANVIAEKMFPLVRRRYNKEVFGHLYAGAGSPWFYRKWSEGYKAFNQAAEGAFANGHRWTASFDLTAFYDSIDHHVLRQMLEKIGVDSDLTRCLTDLLTRWTATSTQIYHNHGIPQGPISSGLIAESVLKHFDENHRTRFDVRYFRYVDDIRLFAKQEAHLRHGLVKLDRLSKDVGLFPQSSKIDIHRVTNIEDELKSISNPIESVLKVKVLNQRDLRQRLADLTPGKKGYAVEKPTRFKYLVAHAQPSAQLADRLWKIYERAPHYYPQVANHLAKFQQLPERHARRLIQEVEAQELYPAIRSAFVHAAVGRIPPAVTPLARGKLKAFWKPRLNQPDFSESLWRWLQEEGHFTPAQIRYALTFNGPGWLIAAMHFGTRWNDVGVAQRNYLLNQSIRSSSTDIAIAAAWISGLLVVPITRPLRDVHPQAKIVLKEIGLIKRADTKVCGIRQAISEMTGADVQVDWRKFFGKNYKSAEAQIVTCKGYFKTSASAWVNATDGFIDWLLLALYASDTTLGNYQLGGVGSVMNSARLKAGYPEVFKLLNQVHAKRYASNLSHAVVKATKKPTQNISFGWLKTGRRLLRGAAAELLSKGF